MAEGVLNGIVSGSSEAYRKTPNASLRLLISNRHSAIAIRKFSRVTTGVLQFDL
jgi:hypothetical protein